MTTNVYLKRKIEERTSQAAVLAGLQQTAVDENRDLRPDERTTFDGIVKRLGELDAEIKRISEAETGSAQFMQIYGAHLDAQSQADRQQQQRQRQWAQAGPEERASFRTFGELFTLSDAFKNYNGHGASGSFEIRGPWLDGLTGVWGSAVEERSGPEGQAGAAPANWPTGPIHGLPAVGSVAWGVGQNVMATDQSDGDASLFWAGPQQWAGPTMPTIRFPLLQVIGRVPTTMGSIEYMYWKPEEAMAGVVPEGELKPEAELAGEIRAETVETYAWWKGITRQALDDIPMIRGIVDTQLRRGVIRRINYQAANALHTNTDIPTAGGADSDLLAVIRMAMAMVEDSGYSANALLLNAMDWASFDVSLLGLQAGAGVTGQRQFWGLVPVPVPTVPAGTAYVGDMSEAVTFFDRQTTNVLMTDSHGDYFLRNKLVVLAEARGRVAVTNAAAVVKCTGDVPDLVIPLAEGAASPGGRAAVGPSRAQARPQPPRERAGQRESGQ